VITVQNVWKWCQTFQNDCVTPVNEERLASKHSP
jgi:hypothetical protein